MWFGFAAASAFFAGVTSILAKCGIQKTDSSVATAIRTIVVLFFSWMMVFIVGSEDSITAISPKAFTFLVLSGLSTGASWLCYFKALQLGDVNKVVPIDKFSTVLTILLALIFLGEPVNGFKAAGIVGIAAGTWLMIQKKETDREKTVGKGWLFYALLSAVFASLTSILGKIGISGVESNLGTAIRTAVVLVMAWVVVFVTKKQDQIRKIDKREGRYLVLSGFATGASWLCYYRALQSGPASLIVPIDKLSIVVSVGFSYGVLKEKLSARAFLGLALIVGGTILMLL